MTICHCGQVHPSRVGGRGPATSPRAGDDLSDRALSDADLYIAGIPEDVGRKRPV
jgi:hypothetical protein